MGQMASPSDDESALVMGYPPPPKYPPPPLHHPHHGYPPPAPNYPMHHQAYASPYHQGYPNQNPYDAQSYNNYYYSQPYEPLAYEKSDKGSFGRALVLLIIILIIGLCMLSLVIWILFGTEIPDFVVSSLTVPDIVITNTTLTAAWIINITVTNSNDDLVIHFTHVRGTMFYKDNLLALAIMKPFDMQPRTHYDLISQVQRSSEKQHPLQEWILLNMEQDLKSGVMLFSMRLNLEAKMVSKSIWRSDTLRVYCENMRVMFTHSSDGNVEGKMIEDSERECLIFT